MKNYEIYRKLISFVTLLSFTTSVFAEVSRMPSLEWQIHELEKKIETKVDETLVGFLPKKSYLTNVELIYTQPQDPDFKGEDDKSKDLEAEKRKQEEFTKEIENLLAKSKSADLKIEEQVATVENEASKKIIEERERIKKREEARNKNAVKYSDLSPDEEKNGDTILMSKFGLEAPLIDDFNDFAPDGKIVLTMSGDGQKDAREADRLRSLVDEKERNIQQIDREMQRRDRDAALKEAALINKLKVFEMQKLSGEGNVSEVEQMWRYNNAIDIFKNLKDVKIKIKIDSSVNEKIRENVEQYVRTINFNLGRIQPKITFEYVPMGTTLNPPDKMEAIKEWIDLVGKYATLIGLVLAMILLGVVGQRLLKAYFDQQASGGSQILSGVLKQEGSEDKNENGHGSGDGVSGLNELENGFSKLSGVERFKNYLKIAPSEALQLVKSWIASDDVQPKEALASIVQQMTNEELWIIFKQLSPSQKNIWKNLLNETLSLAQLKKADSYISNQIIQNVIVPSAVTDPETYDLILKLDSNKIVEMVNEEPQMVALLLNLLNGSFINEILSKCSDSERKELLEESLKITPSEIYNGQGELKEMLRAIVEEKEVNPFVEKIIGLIRVANPSVEDSLFKALSRNYTKDQLKKIGLEQFPAMLVSDLPVPMLKSIIMGYPLEKRIEMLYSLDEESRTFFVNIVAPQGSKAYDMLEIEFEKVANNPIESLRISENPVQIWYEFVQYLRKEVRDDKIYSKEVSDLVNVWAEDLKSRSQTSILRNVA